jgi:hypothetical protein
MTAEKPDDGHFNQKPRRKAEFIKPLNLLRSKAGYGGLDDEILNKAQALLENNSVDFLPMAEMYLAGMMRGIERAGNPAPGESEEVLIAGMLYPTMQLKARARRCAVLTKCPAKRDGRDVPLSTGDADRGQADPVSGSDSRA